MPKISGLPKRLTKSVARVTTWNKLVLRHNQQNCHNDAMPKIIGATIGEHRQKTRQALFDALTSLLREYPFDQITMSQIARRGNVGRTAIYNHFDDKESLLLELMSSATAEFTRVLLEALQVTDDPIQKLRIYMRAQLELKSQFHLAVAVNIRNFSQPSSRLREHARIVRHVMFNLINDAYEAGQIGEAPTRQTINLVRGCLAGQDLPASPEAREQTKIETEAFILRALGASAEEIAWIDPAVTDIEFVFDDSRSTSIPEGDAGSALGNETTQQRCPVTAAG